LLFFALYILYYNTLISKRSFAHPSKALWWFAGYFAIRSLHGIFIIYSYGIFPIPEEMLRSAYRTSMFTLLQLIFFFWIACDLLKGKMVRNACLIFSISSLIVAVGSIFFGLGTPYREIRTTALGSNPDTLGVQMAFTIIILTGLHLTAGPKDFMRSILLLTALTLPPLTLMLKTGSRAGIVVLVTGYLVYILPIVSVKSRWIGGIVVAVAGIAAAVYLAAGSSMYSERWKQAYYEGNFSRRDRIYAHSIEMILERPVFGWHPILHMYELGSRTGYPEMSEHSLVLSLLASDGLVGTIPFLLGLWVCTRKAWEARKGELRLLPLALMVATLTSNLTDSYHDRKSFWFVLALVVAAASVGVQKKVILFGRTRAD
jgi:O-antigen ligase